MSETPKAVATVADLTEEHIGWEIRVADPDSWTSCREFTLAGLRSGTRDGRSWVALLDPSEAGGPWLGTEYLYPAETACAVLRESKLPRRRARRKTHA